MSGANLFRFSGFPDLFSATITPLSDGTSGESRSQQVSKLFGCSTGFSTEASERDAATGRENGILGQQDDAVAAEMILDTLGLRLDPVAPKYADGHDERALNSG